MNFHVSFGVEFSRQEMSEAKDTETMYQSIATKFGEQLTEYMLEYRNFPIQKETDPKTGDATYTLHTIFMSNHPELLITPEEKKEESVWTEPPL